MYTHTQTPGSQLQAGVLYVSVVQSSLSNRSSVTLVCPEETDSETKHMYRTPYWRKKALNKKMRNTVFLFIFLISYYKVKFSICS